MEQKNPHGIKCKCPLISKALSRATIALLVALVALVVSISNIQLIWVILAKSI